MPGSSAANLRSPGTEAIHNHIPPAPAGLTDPATGLPDSVNTVRPRAARCGRCVLTPPGSRRCPNQAPRPKNA